MPFSDVYHLKFPRNMHDFQQIYHLKSALFSDHYLRIFRLFSVQLIQIFSQNSYYYYIKSESELLNLLEIPHPIITHYPCPSRLNSRCLSCLSLLPESSESSPKMLELLPMSPMLLPKLPRHAVVQVASLGSFKVDLIAFIVCSIIPFINVFFVQNLD